jgi:hypothetical protein
MGGGGGLRIMPLWIEGKEQTAPFSPELRLKITRYMASPEHADMIIALLEQIAINGDEEYATWKIAVAEQTDVLSSSSEEEDDEPSRSLLSIDEEEGSESPTLLRSSLEKKRPSSEKKSFKLFASSPPRTSSLKGEVDEDKHAPETSFGTFVVVTSKLLPAEALSPFGYPHLDQPTGGVIYDQHPLWPKMKAALASYGYRVNEVYKGRKQNTLVRALKENGRHYLVAREIRLGCNTLYTDVEHEFEHVIQQHRFATIPSPEESRIGYLPTEVVKVLGPTDQRTNIETQGEMSQTWTFWVEIDAYTREFARLHQRGELTTGNQNLRDLVARIDYHRDKAENGGYPLDEELQETYFPDLEEVFRAYYRENAAEIERSQEESPHEENEYLYTDAKPRGYV